MVGLFFLHFSPGFLIEISDMFPRYFPYGQPSSVPNINPLLSLSLGLPLDATSISPSQDLSSLLLSAQPNISAATTFQAASPYFLPQATQFLAGIPVTNSVNPLMAQFSLSQMLPLLNPALLQNQISEFSSTPSNTTDSHTIVRAPVFYGSSNGNADSQVRVLLSIPSSLTFYIFFTPISDLIANSAPNACFAANLT